MAKKTRVKTGNGFDFFSVIAVVTLIGLTAFWYLGNAWKTYSSQDFLFTFKYPKDWRICEEFYQNNIGRTVHLTNSYDCKSVIYGLEPSFLTITDLGIVTEKIDVRDFLDSEVEKEKRNKDQKKMPTVPGFVWKFDSYQNELLNLEGASIAKIVIPELSNNSYVFLYNYKVYKIDVSPIFEVDKRPIESILMSIKNKDTI